MQWTLFGALSLCLTNGLRLHSLSASLKNTSFAAKCSFFGNAESQEQKFTHPKRSSASSAVQTSAELEIEQVQRMTGKSVATVEFGARA